MVVLTTKLYTPPPRPQSVPRPRLVERLDDGLHRKLTLVSAAAGFGKTTIVSQWVAQLKVPVAWLALDEADSDPVRFLTYLTAALQTIEPDLGSGVMTALQAPQPPPAESILTTLLNALAALPDFVLVLDDYHVLDSPLVDEAVAFLLGYMPPQMHLVIATREDPPLPLARLRARSQLTELRAADLRFTQQEAAEFLNEVMGLDLSAMNIAALEKRTEGWIAGLQLAAVSMQGQHDVAAFIDSFTGSHRFILDYLMEEVLDQQPEGVQAFLLQTAILDRLCGPLCDAVTQGEGGQATLEQLEQANLFIVPLDSERRWYRYHHLFGDLLRQRLDQETSIDVSELHIRASIWFEQNGQDMNAFRHAAAAGDLDRAAYFVEGAGMPLHFRGGVTSVLTWLESLPEAELDARPALWVMYGSALLFVGRLADAEAVMSAAEAALSGLERDERVADLIGHNAASQATVAVARNDADAIISQSQRALANLHPGNLPVRTATTWTLGYAHHLQGDRAAATRAYREARTISEAIGHIIINLMSSIGLGALQLANNDLHTAAQTFEHVIQLAGDPAIPAACEAHRGLAVIHYEWNNWETSHQHAQEAVRLAQQLAATDRYAASKVTLARLKLAAGDVSSADASFSEAENLIRGINTVFIMRDMAALRVRLLLAKGEAEAAAEVAQGLPLARVHLAQGDPDAALAALTPLRERAEAEDWPDQLLRTLVLQAVALNERGDADAALDVLAEALTLAEPGGFVRTFLDEPLNHLISVLAARGSRYSQELLAASEVEGPLRTPQPLLEPLSERELDVLRLIAEGLSNREIGERLFITVSTVKGHNQRIFAKLHVNRRTEAVARARELRLL